jgi:hypothetical protein
MSLRSLLAWKLQCASQPHTNLLLKLAATHVRTLWMPAVVAVMLPFLLYYSAQASLNHNDSPGSRSPCKKPLSPLLLGPTSKRIGPGGLAGVGSSGSIARQWQHLQPDPGPSVDASKIGMQRVPHHAGERKDVPAK